ncbi:hypothetical protein [Methanococcoides sp. NM1]|uniref:hypothetical protein n=1 Tax=Methanococcoides sp. NM1 TaxID=1201013 RepID=UPI001082D9D2|nr:hypothetical protein [Methanococcoides sp. NM1]
MNISPNYRSILADELKYCREKINAENDLKKKVFYYSSAYGMTRRIFNFEFDSQLQFIDFVLNTSYNVILGRINANMSGDNTIVISNDFFDELSKCLESLENRIRTDKDTYDVLEKIINLTFTIDGNGYYLVQKGIQVYK